MNLRRFIPISVAAVLLAGAVWWWARSSDELPSTSSVPGAVPEPTSGATLVSNAPPSQDTLPSHEDLRSRALLIISQPDECKRIREFCEFLRSIRRDNGGAVAEAMERQRLREGKRYLTEEHLLAEYRARLASGIDVPFASLPPESAGLTAAFESAATNSDEIARTLLYCDLAARVNSENWREALSFLKRPHTGAHAINPPWADSIICSRVVRVAGSSAIEEMERITGDTSALRLIEAWSRAVPAEAHAWLTSRPEDKTTKARRFWSARGMASVDPHRAWGLMAGMEEDSRSSAAHILVDHVADDFGWRPAERLYTAIREDSGSSKAVVTKALERMVETRVAMLSGGNMEEAQMTLDWLALQPLEHSEATSRLIFAITEIDPSQAIQWLDRRIDVISPEVATKIYGTVARVWSRNSKDAFATWLRGNPNHPQYRVMTEAANAP